MSQPEEEKCIRIGIDCNPPPQIKTDGLQSYEDRQKEKNGILERKNEVKANIKIRVKEDTKNEKSEIVFQIKEKSVIIVIDPGHGVTPGNFGAASKIYSYTEKDTDTIKRADVLSLPQYVLDNPSTYVKGKSDDSTITEYRIAYKVGVKMVEILENKGYKVINTRKEESIVELSTALTYFDFLPKEGIKDLVRRTKIANENKADYFISVHCDGVDNMAPKGAHAIYNKGDETGKELALDIMKKYTIASIRTTQHPSARNNVWVVGNSNKTKRKTLVELGFLSNPQEAKNLYTNIDKIAQELVEGLELNIDKYF